MPTLAADADLLAIYGTEKLASLPGRLAMGALAHRRGKNEVAEYKQRHEQDQERTELIRALAMAQMAQADGRLQHTRVPFLLSAMRPGADEVGMGQFPYPGMLGPRTIQGDQVPLGLDEGMVRLGSIAAGAGADMAHFEKEAIYYSPPSLLRKATQAAGSAVQHAPVSLAPAAKALAQNTAKVPAAGFAPAPSAQGAARALAQGSSKTAPSVKMPSPAPATGRPMGTEDLGNFADLKPKPGGIPAAPPTKATVPAAAPVGTLAAPQTPPPAAQTRAPTRAAAPDAMGPAKDRHQTMAALDASAPAPAQPGILGRIKDKFAPTGPKLQEAYNTTSTQAHGQTVPFTPAAAVPPAAAGPASKRPGRVMQALSPTARMQAAEMGPAPARTATGRMEEAYAASKGPQGPLPQPSDAKAPVGQQRINALDSLTGNHRPADFGAAPPPMSARQPVELGKQPAPQQGAPAAKGPMPPAIPAAGAAPPAQGIPAASGQQPGAGSPAPPTPPAAGAEAAAEPGSWGDHINRLKATNWPRALGGIAAAGAAGYGLYRGVKGLANWASQESQPQQFNQGAPQMSPGVNQYGYAQPGQPMGY